MRWTQSYFADHRYIILSREIPRDRIRKRDAISLTGRKVAFRRPAENRTGHANDDKKGAARIPDDSFSHVSSLFAIALQSRFLGHIIFRLDYFLNKSECVPVLIRLRIWISSSSSLS